MQKQWFKDVIRASGLWWLQHVSYPILDHGLLCTFIERWYEETSSFHLSIEEMTVTLDDVYSVCCISPLRVACGTTIFLLPGLRRLIWWWSYWGLILKRLSTKHGRSWTHNIS